MKHGQYDPEESYSDWQARVNPPVVFYYLDKYDKIDIVLMDKSTRTFRLFNATTPPPIKDADDVIPSVEVSGIETLKVFYYNNDEPECGLEYRLFARSKDEAIKLVERLTGKPYGGQR